MPFWGWCKNLGQTTVEMFVIEDTGFKGTVCLAASLLQRSVHFAKGVGKFFCGMCGYSECFVETSGLNSNYVVAGSCWESSSVAWVVFPCPAIVAG